MIAHACVPRREPGAPAAVARDIGRIRDSRRLRQEAQAGTIVQLHRAKTKRWRYLRKQCADRGGRQRPDFTLDRGAIARRAACRAGRPVRTGDSRARYARRAGNGRQAPSLDDSAAGRTCARQCRTARSRRRQAHRAAQPAAMRARVAPTRSVRRAMHAHPRAPPSRPSDQAGPISVTPIGMPLPSKPDGTAIAASRRG